MIVISGLIFGAAIGALTAKRRKGNRADMAQYAVGYMIAFGLLGLIATVLIDRVLS